MHRALDFIVLHPNDQSYNRLEVDTAVVVLALGGARSMAEFFLQTIGPANSDMRVALSWRLR
jgi:hypothetical protein